MDSRNIFAALLSLCVVGLASAQTTGGTPQQARAKTDGPSYGPVLHPQYAPSSQTTSESRPQAQEERAGAAAQQQQRQAVVDPSARPSPQPVKPEPTQQQDKKDAKDSKAKPKAKPEPRRSVQRRIEPAPRSDPPSAHPYGRVADPAVGHPAPVVPSSAQVNSCTGGICTDSAGTTYNLGSGNTGVSSDGKLCTRSGNTMQCL